MDAQVYSINNGIGWNLKSKKPYYSSYNLNKFSDVTRKLTLQLHSGFGFFLDKELYIFYSDISRDRDKIHTFCRNIFFWNWNSVAYYGVLARALSSINLKSDSALELKPQINASTFDDLTIFFYQFFECILFFIFSDLVEYLFNVGASPTDNAYGHEQIVVQEATSQVLYILRECRRKHEGLALILKHTLYIII